MLTGFNETKGENMESDIIKISHLNKSFSELKAVNDLSFRVKKGELFAFLGVNGAGVWASSAELYDVVIYVSDAHPIEVIED